MSLHKFITVSSLVLSLIGIGLWIAFSSLTDFAHDIDAEFRTVGQEIESLHDFESALFNQRNALLRQSLLNVSGSAARVNSTASYIRSLSQEISDKYSLPNERNLSVATVEYLTAVEQLSSGKALSVASRREILSRFDRIDFLTKSMLNNRLQAAMTLQGQLSIQANKYRKLSFVFLLPLVVIFLGLAVFFQRYITRPINKISSAIKECANANFQLINEDIGPKEFRTIATAVNKMTERLIEQKNNQIAALATVAHELKNPIAAIHMATDLLATKCPSHLIDVIQRQATHMNRLVDDIHEAGNASPGQLKLEKTKEDIVPLIYDAVEIYKTTTSIHDIKVESSAPSIELDCDRNRFLQILHNLFTNAIKYSPDGGEIKLSVKDLGNAVELRITDSGSGIRPADLDNVFKPFQRFNRDSNRRVPGIGLGLFTVKNIMTAHGGEIRVESQEKGTSFVLTFPKHKLQEADREPPKESFRSVG